MLQFILGRSGSGKTHTIRNILKKELDEAKKIMLIIPEQDSFRNERDILRELGPHDASKVDILSFKRLSDFIFRMVGGLAGDRLNDGGRNILMSLALDQIKDQLNIYKKQYNKVEIIDIMVAALKEFKICSINVDDLLEISKGIKDKILRSKIKETALIIETYNAIISQSYIDPLDNLTRLYEVLKENKFFNGYTVLIDGFNGFTPQEIKILECIFIQAESCYISFCSDSLFEKDNGMMLFSSVYKSIKRVLDIAKKNNITIKKPLILEEQPRFKNLSLSVLEKQIFRPIRSSQSDCPENITIYNASNLYNEVEFVCNNINRLVMEQGYKYKDFAVIARMTDTYRGVIDVAFEKNNIPYFMDRIDIIEEKTLMNFIVSAFEIIHNNYSSGSIFKYLKIGLTSISIDDISILENYVIMWGIDGDDWHKEFTNHPDGFLEKVTEENIQLLQKLNDLRVNILKPLDKFCYKLKTASTGDLFAKAAYELIEEVKVDESIKNLYNSLINNGEKLLADEQIRLWELLIDILDQMSVILKNQRITSKKFAELLEIFIKSSQIAFIPQGMDQVTIGDADRTRLDSPKVVFIVGAVEGEFPRFPVSKGIFNDKERKDLIKMGLPMYNSLEQLVIEERFIAYCAITSVSERLYISWPSNGTSGGSKFPSSIVKSIKSIYPNIPIMDEFLIDDSDKIWSEKTAFDFCARMWNEDSPFSSTLKKYFSNNALYSKTISSINEVCKNTPISFKNPQKSRSLMVNKKISASQIEKYYLCHFQYFCRYILNAKERKPVVFDSLEYGSLMHFIMETILSNHDIKDLKNMDSSELSLKVTHILEEYVNYKLGGLQNKTSRFKYLFYRLSNTACVLISHIVEELSQSEFLPTDYELDISSFGDIAPLMVKIPGGEVVQIQGKVDRVDIMRVGDKSYVRVIDYKTGNKEFKLSDVLYGLNMQMLIYLAAICRNGSNKYGNVIPAGVLYMPAIKPLINDKRGIDEETLDKQRKRKLRMNGLILDSAQIVQGMESNANGIFIPVSIKDGKVSKSESVANLAQMGAIMKYIENLVVSMVNNLNNGDIKAEPVDGEYNSCEWCPYSSVCGYEKDNEAVIIKKASKDEVMNELCRKGYYNGEKTMD